MSRSGTWSAPASPGPSGTHQWPQEPSLPVLTVIPSCQTQQDFCKQDNPEGINEHRDQRHVLSGWIGPKAHPHPLPLSICRVASEPADRIRPQFPCLTLCVCECVSVCVCVKSLQSCLTLCDPMNYRSPGSSVHGILQARILEWVAMPFSRGSNPPRDRTRISYISCSGRQEPTPSLPLTLELFPGPQRAPMGPVPCHAQGWPPRWSATS